MVQCRGFPSPCVFLSDRVTSVGQARLILTRSGSGDPELQRWARDLPVGETSGLDVPVARGGSDATRASERVSPAMVQEPFFIVARGPSDATRASERVSSASSIVKLCF